MTAVTLPYNEREREDKAQLEGNLEMDEELCRDLKVHQVHVDIHVQQLVDPEITSGWCQDHVVKHELLKAENYDADYGNS